MTYFQVNERCNGCLACVQNCPARALQGIEQNGVQVLRHNMARCARCATCWRVCPHHAVEFEHMLHNNWDDIVSHRLVRCELCGDVAYTVLLKDSLDPKVREMMEPLCSRHKLEKQAGTLLGRGRTPGRTAP